MPRRAVPSLAYSRSRRTISLVQRRRRRRQRRRRGARVPVRCRTLGWTVRSGRSVEVLAVRAGSSSCSSRCRAASRRPCPRRSRDSSRLSAGSSSAGRTSTLVTRKPARFAVSTRRPRPSLPGPETLDARSAAAQRQRLVLLEDAQADLLDFVAKRRRALELELLGGAFISASIRATSFSMAAVFSRVSARLASSRAPTCRRRSDSATTRSRSLMSWMPLTIRRRLDAALRVVGHLDRAPAVRLLDRRGPSTRSTRSGTYDLSADVAGARPISG